MHVKRLSLTHFRNYTRLELELPARVHVLRGDNAQGKTNLLEALFYIATTRSPLASSDRQLIAWSASEEVIPFARVEADYVRGGREHTLEITMQLEPQEGGAAELALRRKIRLDGVPRRAMDVLGQLNVVLFLPQDIALVNGSPGQRRRYLDVTLCQIDSAYCRALSRYGRILTQRNALLNSVRERRAALHELDYWDTQLSECGALVLARRIWAVERLNPLVDAVQRALTGQSEGLVLSYQSAVPTQGDVETIARAFAQALQAARREELARGVTARGPHRDDLRFALNGVDATVYGSRGQQRTVALALRLAEMELMSQHTGEAPVLLLDDVASELDVRRCSYLLERVADVEQAFVTTTDLQALTPAFLERALLWQVLAGTVTRVSGA